MPLNLETLPAREAEALAYSEGFTGTARLFARIDDLQRALGEAVNEIEQLKTDLHAARYERAFLGADE
jgi:hypothetical protein